LIDRISCSLSFSRSCCVCVGGGRGDPRPVVFVCGMCLFRAREGGHAGLRAGACQANRYVEQTSAYEAALRLLHDNWDGYGGATRREMLRLLPPSRAALVDGGGGSHGVAEGKTGLAATVLVNTLALNLGVAHEHAASSAFQPPPPRRKNEQMKAKRDDGCAHSHMPLRHETRAAPRHHCAGGERLLRLRAAVEQYAVVLRTEPTYQRAALNHRA
jgi:hypothetical protein